MLGFTLVLSLSSCGDDNSSESMNSNTKVADGRVEKKFNSLFPWDHDKKLAIEKLKESGAAYSQLAPELQKDKDIALIALKHGMALWMLDESFQKDKEIALILLKTDPSKFKSIDDSLKPDPDIILASLKGPYSTALDSLKHQMNLKMILISCCKCWL